MKIWVKKVLEKISYLAKYALNLIPIVVLESLDAAGFRKGLKMLYKNYFNANY